MFFKKTLALKNIQKYINQNRWQELESESYNLCLKYSGEENANKIKSFDIDEYKKEIEIYLKKSLEIANKKNSKAICFTLQPETGWIGEFLIYQSYVKRANDKVQNRNHWSFLFSDEVKLPKNDFLINIFSKFGIFSFNKKKAAFIYVMIRIMRALNDLKDILYNKDIALIVFWYIDDTIIAIKE